MDPPISPGLQAELPAHFTDEAAEHQALVQGASQPQIQDFLALPRAFASLNRLNLGESIQPSSQVCPPEGGLHSKVPTPGREVSLRGRDGAGAGQRTEVQQLQAGASSLPRGIRILNWNLACQVMMKVYLSE